MKAVSQLFGFVILLYSIRLSRGIALVGKKIAAIVGHTLNFAGGRRHLGMGRDLLGALGAAELPSKPRESVSLPPAGGADRESGVRMRRRPGGAQSGVPKSVNDEANLVTPARSQDNCDPRRSGEDAIPDEEHAAAPDIRCLHSASPSVLVCTQK